MISIELIIYIFQLWQNSFKNFVIPNQVLKFFVTEASSALLHFSYFSYIDYFSGK